MNKSIFQFTSYKPYLIQAFGGSRKKTGQRAAAARHMGCQTTYLSQVLHGRANLSLEQAFALNGFLGHDGDESECFLFLLQKERAGTEELRAYFVNKINELTERRLTLKNPLQAKPEVSAIDQAKFYSRWYHAAIHVLLSIPELRTKQAIAAHLGLPLEQVANALEFLERCGLAIADGGLYQIGPRNVHLGKESPHIAKHHTNWRMRAIHSLDTPRALDMHYSLVATLSREDAVKIKRQLLQTIEDHLKLIGPSKEEVAFAYAIDFFEV